MHACMYVTMYVCMYVHVRMCVCMYVCIYVCIHICMSVCLYRRPLNSRTAVSDALVRELGSIRLSNVTSDKTLYT